MFVCNVMVFVNDLFTRRKTKTVQYFTRIKGNKVVYCSKTFNLVGYSNHWELNIFLSCQITYTITSSVRTVRQIVVLTTNGRYHVQRKAVNRQHNHKIIRGFISVAVYLTIII